VSGIFPSETAVTRLVGPVARKPGALRNGAPFKDWLCSRPGWSGSARGRLRPVRQPEESRVMERSEILTAMAELKLYGMIAFSADWTGPRKQNWAIAAVSRA
jgi:hypothetical protein